MSMTVAEADNLKTEVAPKLDDGVVATTTGQHDMIATMIN